MGEYLREAAINGDLELVKSIMKDKGNPCSIDQYGLSPLMYAVWNGHIDCVKVLLANGSYGVCTDGRRGSAINLASVKGLTALHLAAIDIPPWSAHEICYSLLLFGADRRMRSKEGFTARELAEENSNTPILEAFTQFEEAEKMNKLPSIISTELTLRGLRADIWNKMEILTETKEKENNAIKILENQILKTKTKGPKGFLLQKQFDFINSKYQFPRAPHRTLNIREIENDISKRNCTVENKDKIFDKNGVINNEKTEEKKNQLSIVNKIENDGPVVLAGADCGDRRTFFAPSFLVTDRTPVPLPAGMALHEHNISPLTLLGGKLPGVKALKCLGYVEEQATLNLIRRKNILLAAEKSLLSNKGNLSAIPNIGNSCALSGTNG